MSKVKKEKVVKKRVTLSGNVDLDKVIAELPSVFPGLEVKAFAKRSKKASKKAEPVLVSEV